MPNKGLAELLTILIIISFFTIGIFFKGKLKVFRYVFFSIGLFILITVLFDNFFKSDMRLQREQELLGEYGFVFNNSKYDLIDLSQATVVLKLNTDNTFSIINGAQFFKETSGTWELLDNGDFEYIEYSFKNSPAVTKTGADLEIWTFSGDELKSNTDANKLTFSK